MALVLTYLVTTWSFDYANSALKTCDPNFEIAAIIAAIQVPVTWMMTFISKLYWAQRTSDIKETQ